MRHPIFEEIQVIARQFDGEVLNDRTIEALRYAVAERVRYYDRSAEREMYVGRSIDSTSIIITLPNCFHVPSLAIHNMNELRTFSKRRRKSLKTYKPNWKKEGF